MKQKLSTILQFKNGKKRPQSEGSIPVYGGNGILGFTDQSNNDNCEDIFVLAHEKPSGMYFAHKKTVYIFVQKYK